ncbi:CgeB family protein [Negadavirga shengliensis]|uniref:Glycosyltransferase n=1 Tax=Negadavirga shengliensis TaxID=1389218 RepID=A0ABV9T6D2_9BACT
MKITMFYHSLFSDWNHGNAHFLRGVVDELHAKNHEVTVYEPYNGWSLRNMLLDHGMQTIHQFQEYYPNLKGAFYDDDNRDEIEFIVEDSDLVIVHEWNAPHLIKILGRIKRKHGFLLLFHDTHHRAISKPKEMEQFDFSDFDGALVFGKVLKSLYDEKNWFPNVWIWHEAADVKRFKPYPKAEKEGDLVWIGNWGDKEREDELMEFLIRPVKELGVKAKVYGVRYPDHALRELKAAGIAYGGWLPNYKVPETLAKYKVTLHIPRKPYVQLLHGIPTIRPFEAMACGIPLICSPWHDTEALFQKGKDYLPATDGEKMREHIQDLLEDHSKADALSLHANNTILDRHTCSHRVGQLETIVSQLRLQQSIPIN